MGGRGAGTGRSSGAGGAGVGSWEKSGNGQWDIDVPGKGGAQILEGTDLYSRDTTYEVHMWDSNYQMLPTQTVATLSTAKSVVKNRLGIGRVR